MQARYWLLGVVSLVGASLAVAHFKPSAPAGGSRKQYNGIVESKFVHVSAIQEGRIDAILVDDGAVVTKGQLLFQLDTSLIDSQINEQRARVEEERANHSLMKAGRRKEEVSRSRIERDLAQLEYSRIEKLAERNLVPRRLLDEAKAMLWIREQSYQENVKGNRMEEIEAVNARLNQQEAKLDLLLTQKEKMRVLAPSDGIIQAVSARPGDYLGLGDSALLLLEASETYVKAFVPELDIPFFTIGQEVLVSTDASPGEVIKGVVTFISHQAEYTPRTVYVPDQRSHVMFAIKVKFPKDNRFKSGMAATVHP